MFFCFVPGAGNRTWTCTVAHWNLNPACLPIPPYPHMRLLYHKHRLKSILFFGILWEWLIFRIVCAILIPFGYCDVTIRCYLLGQAIAAVLDDMGMWGASRDSGIYPHGLQFCRWAFPPGGLDRKIKPKRRPPRAASSPGRPPAVWRWQGSKRKEFTPWKKWILVKPF